MFSNCLVKMKNYRVTNRFPHYKFFVGSLTLYGFSCYCSKKTNLTSLKLGIVGSSAFFISDAIIHPLYVINCEVKSNITTTNSIGVIKNIYSKEGIQGFFKGMSATYYMGLVGGFIYFTLYKFLKSSIKLESTSENMLYNTLVCFFSASLSEILSLLITYPFEFIKVRMISGSKETKYKTVFEGFRNLLGNNVFKNIPNLYIGSSYCFVYYTTNRAIMFGVLELCRDYFKIKNNYKNVQELTMFQYLICSLSAGFASAFCTNFLDVILVNKQIYGKNFNILKLIKELRFSIFFKGMGPNTIMETVIVFITFFIVDNLALVFEVEL